MALLFVSLADLTQDQRQVLTSLMAHRNRALTDYRMEELREVYLEVFCTTRTSVENPLLAPSGHGGRKSFLVIDEGSLDDHDGYWVEDEEDGTEGFLESYDDVFWVYDDESAAWFQRRFQGRKMTRNKGKGKEKEKEKDVEEEADASSKDAKEKDILQKIKVKPGKVNGGKTVPGMMIISGPGRPMMSPMPSKAKERKERKAKAKESGTKKVEKITPKEIPPILP